jgi:hypothetical protein
LPWSIRRGGAAARSRIGCRSLMPIIITMNFGLSAAMIPLIT